MPAPVAPAPVAPAPVAPAPVAPAPPEAAPVAERPAAATPTAGGPTAGQPPATSPAAAGTAPDPAGADAGAPRRARHTEPYARAARPTNPYGVPDQTVAFQITPAMLDEMEARLDEAEQRRLDMSDSRRSRGGRAPAGTGKQTLMGAPGVNLRKLAERQTASQMQAVTPDDLDGEAKTEVVDIDAIDKAIEAQTAPPPPAPKQTLMGAPGINLRQLGNLPGRRSSSLLPVADAAAVAAFEAPSGRAAAPGTSAPDAESEASTMLAEPPSEAEFEAALAESPPLVPIDLPPPVQPGDPASLPPADGQSAPPQLPGIPLTPEEVVSLLEPAPAGAFSRVGYGFRAGKVRRRVAKALSLIEKRCKLLGEFQDKLAVELGRRVFQEGPPGSAGTTLEAHREELASAEQGLRLTEQAAAGKEAAFEGVNAAKTQALSEATAANEVARTALAEVEGRYKALTAELRQHQGAIQKIQRKASALEKGQADGWQAQKAELEAQAAQHEAELQPLQARTAPLQEELGESRARAQAAKAEMSQAKQAVDAARAEHKRDAQGAQRHVDAAKARLESAHAAIEEPCRDLGVAIAHDMNRGREYQEAGHIARAGVLLGEEEALATRYTAVLGYVDQPSVQSGRMLLLVIALGTLLLLGAAFVFLPWTDPFGIYGGSETVSAESSVSSAPSGARNQGASARALAEQLLAPGQHLYVGASLDGLRKAELLSGLGLERMIARIGPLRVLLGGDSPIDRDAMRAMVLSSSGGDATGVVETGADGAALNEALHARSDTEVETIRGRKVAVRHGKVAWSDSDGRLIFGKRGPVGRVFARLDGEHDSALEGSSKLRALVAAIDLDASVWVVVVGAYLDDLRDEVPSDAIPADAERILSALKGAAASAHVSDAVHLQIALHFKSDEDAEKAVDRLGNLSKLASRELEGLPDEQKPLVEAAHIVLESFEMDHDGRVATLTLALEDDDATAVISGVQRIWLD